MRHPIIDQFQEQFLMAHVNEQTIKIVGGDTKSWYGNRVQGNPMSTKVYKGVVEYSPAESVITVRSGTPVTEVQAVLSEYNQMLAFDVPFGEQGATIGGTVATGWTGASRPYLGPVKDYVLGTSVLNAKGHYLQFGGKVVKNVAGYDLSRVFVGSHGVLGLILDISLRVMVRPELTQTIRVPASLEQALQVLPELRVQPYPITAAVWSAAEKAYFVRLAGTELALKNARFILGGDVLSPEQQIEWWNKINRLEHLSPASQALRCIQVPAHAPLTDFGSPFFIDWGGSLRWSVYHQEEKAHERTLVEQSQGTIQYFEPHASSTYECFHPLSSGLQAIQYRLKETFDPAKILNPKRLYHYL